MDVFFEVLGIGVVLGLIGAAILGKQRGLGFWWNAAGGVAGAFLGIWIFSLVGLRATNVLALVLLSAVGVAGVMWALHFVKWRGQKK